MQPLTSAAGTIRGADAAWDLVLAAAAAAESAASAGIASAFSVGDGARLRSVAADDASGVVAWRPGHGWDLLLAPDDPERAFVDLYLPVCSATRSRPITVGHLGQSLDGFIATHGGDSQFVTGPENILHLHRMRALSDCVVVGAGTVAADDPLLTTRQVSGPNPLRVVLDPGRRLSEHYRIFADAATPTLYACLESLTTPDEPRFGAAEILPLSEDGDAHVVELLRALRARGCRRVFVEGGGVTVSAFLEAGLLDRLQMAVAPLLVGNGIPAIRLQPRESLSECRRPSYRVFRMGGDVLFDCDLGSEAPAGAGGPDPSGVSRVI